MHPQATYMIAAAERIAEFGHTKGAYADKKDFCTYARVAQEVRVAADIKRQSPDIPWKEALHIAKKWVDADSLTDAPKPLEHATDSLSPDSLSPDSLSRYL